MTATATTTTLPPVGSYVFTCWGYDETRYDFYRVTGHTPSGKSIRVQKVAPHRVPLGSQEVVRPTEEPATVWTYDSQGERHEGPAPVRTVRWARDYCTVDRHTAWAWDGREKYATAPGWGH